MRNYLDALELVITRGHIKPSRPGIDTLSVFGAQLTFNLQHGFPLVTTKKIHWKSVVHELLWFISGDTNTKYLRDNGVTIWDEWADDDGDLGPVYGSQWRSWNERNSRYGGIDQLQDMINNIRHNPHDRRHIVTAWNPTDVPDMALPPCHMFYQYYVGNGFLSSQVYMRSADIFLGVPFNIASYALLNMMIAQVVGLKPGMLIMTFGDLHLYTNHWNQAVEQLYREPRKQPQVVINPNVNHIDHFKFEDIDLRGYDPHPAIKAPVAV